MDRAGVDGMSDPQEVVVAKHPTVSLDKPRTPTSDPVAAAWTQLWTDLFRDHQSWHTTFEEHRPLIEEAIRQQARAAFAAQVAALRASLKEVLDRIDYINGYDARAVLERARAALAASPEPASPEAPGSGLATSYTVRIRTPDDYDAEGRALRFTAQAEHPVGYPYTYSTIGFAVYVDFARPDGAEADVETDCNHPRVGPMAPDFPGEWACYRCGQRFMPQNAARPDASPGSGLDDLREALADARRLAYPFSLSPVQRDRIIARIDTLLNAARPDGAEADAS